MLLSTFRNKFTTCSAETPSFSVKLSKYMSQAQHSHDTPTHSKTSQTDQNYLQED